MRWGLGVERWTFGKRLLRRGYTQSSIFYPLSLAVAVHDLFPTRPSCIREITSA
jgi:hypothetical protein